MMRHVTPEAIFKKRLDLRSLDTDWGQMNRRGVSKSLRNSLYTKIVETRAALEAMETEMVAQLRRSARALAKADVDRSAEVAA